MVDECLIVLREMLILGYPEDGIVIYERITLPVVFHMYSRLEFQANRYRLVIFCDAQFEGRIDKWQPVVANHHVYRTSIS